MKPTVRKSFVRGESLRWIKVCQTSDQILEVRVKGLHIPSGERFTRVLLVEAASKHFQHLAPRAVAEVSQQPVETFRVRKVRNLAFQNVGLCYLTFGERLFINIQDDMLQYSIDRLFHEVSHHPFPGRAEPEHS